MPVFSPNQKRLNQDNMRYVPSADDLVACFQQEGWAGAWYPEQYLTARELEKAAENWKIAIDAHFIYTITDGRMDYP